MSKIKGFIGETLIYGFANVFSRVFAMLLIPFYIQYLGPNDYSILVIVQSIFVVFTFVFALNSGVMFYYYEWKRDRYQKMVFTSWFYYQLGCAFLFGGVLFFASKNLLFIFSNFDGNPEDIQLLIQLTALQFIPYIFNYTNINYYRVDRKPKGAVAVVFLEALFTMLIVILGLHFFDFGMIEVLLGQIAARMLVTLIFLKTSRNYLDLAYFSINVLKRLFSFAWPFIIISIFSWTTISIDKFIGASVLKDTHDVAILALAMQLTIPIVVLADMIRMAIGPFIMSIKEEKDATQSYQQVFDLSVFSALVVLVGIVIATPLLTQILADNTFLKVIQVIPLIGLASVLSLVGNQFSISFSLVKKNVYILIPAVISGVLVIVINALFMRDYGFVISGVSQVVSTFVMATILFILGRKVTELSINLWRSFLLVLIVSAFIGLLYLDMDAILDGSYFTLVFGGGICLTLLSFVYLITYKKSKQAVD